MPTRNLRAAILIAASPLVAAAAQRGGAPTPMDSVRARMLYVSNKPEDMPKLSEAAAQRQIASRERADSIFAARSQGLMKFEKVTYKSDVDGLEIPAYVFSPLEKPAGRKFAAMVWVHGYVHGSFTLDFYPFVKEAVQRGYVIIAPQYRGSVGYGAAFHDAIDYGGKEVDDVFSSYAYIKANLPYVDTTRVGIMGWSHGGFITSHILFRPTQPFKAGAPIVPVTNLFFRLSLKGPGYARQFSTQPGFSGLPFERREEYVKRSPVFHAENLKVPILVFAATNDCDVDFIENQQMVYTLIALKPQLAETKIYKDPPVGPAGCGHTFSQRVDMTTLERQDTPEQIDAWNRIWAFFERNLNPKK
jgi:dipeptidyl aminopeptidase/acylaminoacyl peptidase